MYVCMYVCPVCLYMQVRQALVDMEAMFELKDVQPKVVEKAHAAPLLLDSGR